MNTNSEVTRPGQSEAIREKITHQRYLVAGKFIKNSLKSRPALKKILGIIKQFLEIKVSFALNNRSIKLVVVEWIYGIHNTEELGVIFANINSRGRLNQKESLTSVESLDVIDRVVGYFDFRGSRFLLDQRMQHILDGDLMIGVLAS